jgi:hypothetical protein
MAKQETLKKIHQEIENGDLGKARDRLNGLIKSYPDDLSIRKLLGDVYWKMQMPMMAGRYWYLEAVKDENMVMACKCFENHFGNNPDYLLRAIKFKGQLALIQNEYAGIVLLRLNEGANRTPNFHEHQEEIFPVTYRSMVQPSKKIEFSKLFFLCLKIGILMVGFVFMLIGIITIASMIF